MKIVIVGGHLGPALAIIDALPKGTEILFIGRKYALEGDKAHSLEYQKITSLNIPFVNLPTGRLQRKFTRYTIPSLLKPPIGFIQALKVLFSFKPNVVVCFGGYVQIPVALAASLLNIPVIVHEQTLKAGLANKLISHLARTICISWPESAVFFPSQKTILTGLPLRREFYKESRSVKDNKKKIIYITGGSLGAHPINLLIEGTLEKLLEKFYLIHQTGSATQYKDYERLEKIRQKMPVALQNKYKLAQFIDPDEAAQAMGSSDLVISRSGINTVAELLYLEKPCLLIPLPHGQNNEQLQNAAFLERLGFAKVLRQEELTPEILYSQITDFIAKLDKLRNKATEAKKLIKNDAAEKIVKIITEIYSQKNTPKK